MSSQQPNALRRLSIKWKLTLMIMLATTVALLLISAAFVAYDSFKFKESMRLELSGLAKFIAKQNNGALLYDKNEDAYDSLEALSAKPDIILACLYNDRGEIFATYPRDIARERVPKKPLADSSKFEREDDYLTLFHTIRDNGQVIGTVYLVSDLNELHQRLWQYAQIIVLFMLICLLFTFLLSSWLQRFISEPISSLVTAARTVSAEKNYRVRATKQSEDELGQLVDGFNEMLTQIQERDAALQQANDKLERRVGERTHDLQLEIAERQRAQEAMQQQVMRISLLNQITQTIADRQDLGSILQSVLRQLEDHLKVDLGIVYMLEGSNDSLVVRGMREKNPRLPRELGLHNGGGISLERSGFSSCRQGGLVYMPDTRKLGAELARKLASAEVHCAAGVPLMVEGKLSGILAVARVEANSFSNGECEFLRMLSEHVALAAHQAKLHTELEEAYNNLRQSQQAVMQQDRLRALGQMASGIAHDINNALSPVVGFAGLLLEYEPNLSASARKHLNYIKTSGSDVAHIVARLREFYRQRDGQELIFALNLNQLLEQVIDMTRPRWRDIPQSRGIMVELKTDFAADLPEVLGIESEVREAVTNLIMNAVDAMPKGGTLTVRTRARGVAFTSNGDKPTTHGILEISDNGTGMSEETLKHCLEPFYSTKGKRGTGMGLAMAYGVMERHGGKIEIESEWGKGTLIRLIFPFGNQKSVAAAPEPIVCVSPLKILCIDDEPALRELLKDMLDKEGHNVQTAEGGQNGLEAFRAAKIQGCPFDIVVSDLGMPYMDGREVAKQLKLESPFVPVVLLTGWGAFMKSDGDVPAGVDGILSKPPRSNELREMLGRLTVKQNAPVTSQLAASSP